MDKRVCIIPARSGSQRIPGKNIRMFHGQPIIAYSIQTALTSKLFELVVVSTDDNEIAKIAEIYGAMVLMRDEEHSADSVGTQAVARNVLDELEVGSLESGPMDFDLACVIYATAPMLRIEDLERGLDGIAATGASFAFSVNSAPLEDAGQFYWGHADEFDRVDLISESSCMIPIDPARVCDINVEQDWQKAEQMYAKLKQEGKI